MPDNKLSTPIIGCHLATFDSRRSCIARQQVIMRPKFFVLNVFYVNHQKLYVDRTFATTAGSRAEVSRGMDCLLFSYTRFKYIYMNNIYFCLPANYRSVIAHKVVCRWPALDKTMCFRSCCCLSVLIRRKIDQPNTMSVVSLSSLGRHALSVCILFFIFGSLSGFAPPSHHLSSIRRHAMRFTLSHTKTSLWSKPFYAVFSPPQNLRITTTLIRPLAHALSHST